MSSSNNSRYFCEVCKKYFHNNEKLQHNQSKGHLFKLSKLHRKQNKPQKQLLPQKQKIVIGPQIPKERKNITGKKRKRNTNAGFFKEKFGDEYSVLKKETERAQQLERQKIEEEIQKKKREILQSLNQRNVTHATTKERKEEMKPEVKEEMKQVKEHVDEPIKEESTKVHDTEDPILKDDALEQQRKEFEKLMKGKSSQEILEMMKANFLASQNESKDYYDDPEYLFEMEDSEEQHIRQVAESRLQKEKLAKREQAMEQQLLQEKESLKTLKPKVVEESDEYQSRCYSTGFGEWKTKKVKYSESHGDVEDTEIELSFSKD